MALVLSALASLSIADRLK